MELLHRLWTTRDFTLPRFELTPLEFDPEADRAGGELLLDAIVAGIGSDRHSAPPLEPADELRNALAEVRRSLA